MHATAVVQCSLGVNQVLQHLKSNDLILNKFLVQIKQLNALLF